MFRTEPSFRAHAQADNMPDFCGLPTCGVSLGESGRCTRCKAIMYCGAAHQKKNYRRHREACRRIETARMEEAQAHFLEHIF